ncbi:MAG: hypothetical protein EOP62_11445 [Sphingomonadales bacterium]|nr:MAG: hypothetical protein EOP62_11445 [Sphingomonadales bacterium]
MTGRLADEIYGFSARDFAGWLEGGIGTYFGNIHLPSGMRMADAFEFAELYIGRNDNDVAADLRDVYLDLPPRARVAFERGLAILWSELEFKEEATFRLAEIVLLLGCRLPATPMIDVLQSALPWLGASIDEFSESAGRVRRKAFQAAVELARGNTESILCLEAFLNDNSIEEALLERGQALTMLRYLALKSPDKLIYWAALFGDLIVADAQADEVEPEEVRGAIIKAYGEEELQRVIDYVRKEGVNRLATESIALLEGSIDGLYNLVSLLDAPVGDSATVKQNTTLPWGSTLPSKQSRTGQVIDMQLVRELRGQN